ncbi:MAG: hypothetical protein H0U06_00540 [Solirubrobacterales bacterium]|nr:hypothetical protein [Solirubrobacterales bacterium]
MSRRQRTIVAAFFALAYAVNSAVHGEVFVGIVTGAIGALLVYLVLGRVEQHNAAVARRRRERSGE